MTTNSQPPYRLGKAAAKSDRRNLKLAKYVSLSQLPTPPDDVDNTVDCKQPFGLYDNDKFGDCTACGCCNLIHIWTALSGNEQVPSTQDAITLYSAVTGFDPSTDTNDNGAVELDVLNYWRKTPVAGQEILAHVEVDPTNAEMLQVANWLFGGIYFGAAMPQAWQSETGVGKVWTAPPSQGANGIWTAGTWGGHCFVGSRYIAKTGLWEVITWAFKQGLESAAVAVYADETHALLPSSWQTNFPPAAQRGGFDFEQLQADLQQVTTQPINT